MPGPRIFLLAEIAAKVEGMMLGGQNPEIRGIATLANATSSELSFLTNSKYRAQLASTRAGAVLLSTADRNSTLLPRIVCADPYLAYAKAAEMLFPAAEIVPGAHSTAVVDPAARIGSGTQVGPFCSIGRDAIVGECVSLGAGCVIGDGVVIGDNSTFHPNVVVYAGCRIGRRAIVHSGAIIGADGFGMAKDGEGWRKIPQIGGVDIGDDVEIGANTTIDRGALEDTVIESGVKLDNQIQIGHNVRIGAHSAFAGCVGIAGSTKVGRRCTIGGGSVVLGHLDLADDVHIGAASVVTKSIYKSGAYAGLYPLQENSVWARNAARLRNLDSLVHRMQALELEMIEMKKNRA
jgi:UDP-3-O-[3-hydroxymyristoyl] glucosamine N-acyltransferase